MLSLANIVEYFYTEHEKKKKRTCPKKVNFSVRKLDTKGITVVPL